MEETFWPGYRKVRYRRRIASSVIIRAHWPHHSRHKTNLPPQSPHTWTTLDRLWGRGPCNTPPATAPPHCRAVPDAYVRLHSPSHTRRPRAAHDAVSLTAGFGFGWLMLFSATRGRWRSSRSAFSCPARPAIAAVGRSTSSRVVSGQGCLQENTLNECVAYRTYVFEHFICIIAEWTGKFM